MQRYQLKVEGIPEYINMLEDTQRQARWAGRKIANETLILFCHHGDAHNRAISARKQRLGRARGTGQDLDAMEDGIQEGPCQSKDKITGQRWH